MACMIYVHCKPHPLSIVWSEEEEEPDSDLGSSSDSESESEDSGRRRGRAKKAAADSLFSCKISAVSNLEVIDCKDFRNDKCVHRPEVGSVQFYEL